MTQSDRALVLSTRGRALGSEEMWNFGWAITGTANTTCLDVAI